MRSRPAVLGATLLLAWSWASGSPPGSGQVVPRTSVASQEQPAELEPPYLEIATLLEKTLFRIDVAFLRVRFGAGTVSRVSALLAERLPASVAADSVVAVALRSRNAWAEMTFLRDVGFERFMEGIRDGVVVAREAGVLDVPFAATLLDSLPVWYTPLRSRGVREGDAMTYRIRGDTLRTRFRTAEGQLLVDHLDVAPQAPVSVLGGFFSPGSDFREGLVRSMLTAGRGS